MIFLLFQRVSADRGDFSTNSPPLCNIKRDSRNMESWSIWRLLFIFYTFVRSNPESRFQNLNYTGAAKGRIRRNEASRRRGVEASRYESRIRGSIQVLVLTRRTPHLSSGLVFNLKITSFYQLHYGYSLTDNFVTTKSLTLIDRPVKRDYRELIVEVVIAWHVKTSDYNY